jgi:lipopolysaccharide/colanic/teichoic acid biosynthesis glycosyltransferase
VKRIFDILSSSLVLVLLAPFFLIIALLIVLDSKGGVFFKQIRIGKGEKEFRLIKFRTMRPDSDRLSQITVGDRDPRVTRIGYFLRKYKLDEIPQLINIIKGDMSVVGPRPEVPKYVKLYTDEQRKVLTIRPGLTDYASLHYVNESEILAQAKDPEKAYIHEIMPHKLELNQKYIREKSFLTDLKIILQTLLRIIR